MTVSVDEAIAVLRDAASSPRSRAALSTLEADLTGPGRREPDPETSGKPRFPTKDTVDAHYADGEDDNSARGGHSPNGARGTATARKGT